MRETSRFHNWSKIWSFILIAIVFTAMAIGFSSLAHVDAMKPAYNDASGPMSEQAKGQGSATVDDQALYAHIADRVRSGDDYYHAAAVEHRASGYPLKPFMTVRLPTLAMMHVVLGNKLMQLFAAMIAVIIAVCWYYRLKRSAPAISPRIGTILAFIGAIPFFWPKWLYTHDVWAGGFIAMAIAIYRTHKPWPALALLFAALFIRETVLPAILLAGAFAFYRRRWVECITILLGCAIFAGIMFLHSNAVAAVTKPGDLVSPGWAKAGGIATWLLFLQETSVLRVIPALTPIIVPLSLLGMLAWRHSVGLFLFLFQCGYALLFMLIGRPDNFYWGFLVTPTLLIGLPFLPSALSDIVQSLTRSNKNSKYTVSPS